MRAAARVVQGRLLGLHTFDDRRNVRARRPGVRIPWRQVCSWIHQRPLPQRREVDFVETVTGGDLRSKPTSHIDLRLRPIVLESTNLPSATGHGLCLTIHAARRSRSNPARPRAVSIPASATRSQDFLQQEGHLSQMICSISYVFRRRASGEHCLCTLQWMVEAGIARKVDFGEDALATNRRMASPAFPSDLQGGHRSSEFLSFGHRDARREVAPPRIRPTQTVVQITGVCEECRTGSSVSEHDGRRPSVYREGRLRIAIATSAAAGILHAAASRRRTPAASRSFSGSPREH